MFRLAVILVLGVLAQQSFADEPEAIVGGSLAAPGEFPHQVSLQLNSRHHCGASIITPTKILTAAHCVDDIAYPPYSNFVVVTGSIDNRAGNTHKIKHIQVHPKYIPDGSVSWVNDIAVITLHTEIKYNAYQRPIPLTNSPPRVGIPCTLSGWGRTKADGPYPQYLLKMSTTLLSRDDCQRRFSLQPIYENSHLCALTRYGVGACPGDSGGPLICGGQQYGITSFVLPCALGVPDVYTSVYPHLNFIRQCIAYNP